MDITKFIVSHRDIALLVGEYKTYHHQLTQQLASLRKRLGRATPKSGKFAKKPDITVEDIGRSSEYAHLLLLSAERAYAHALSMKTSGTEDGTGLPAATRAHIAQRTHKAASYASELANLLSSSSSVTKATATDVLEAKAYAFTLHGASQLEKHGAGNRSNNVELQREKWATCLENYAAARVVYVALLKSSKDDVFKEFVAGTVDPAIRFAAYQSHIPRTVPTVTVSRLCFPSDETDLRESVEKLDATAFDDGKTVAGGAQGSADVPSSIDWRGRKAKISDAAIGQALASVFAETAILEKALKREDTKDKSTAYDAVLTAVQDATDATRHAIDDHEKEKISEAEPRMQDLRVTNLAVNYDLISWRVGRNRVLIGSDDGLTLKATTAKSSRASRRDGKVSPEKPEGSGRKLARLRERIVLYDAILQSLESVKEVPGAMRDTAFIKELEGKESYFRALKCLNIAFSHTIISPPSHKNALALLVRAEDLSAQASKALTETAPQQEGSPLRLDISSSRLHSLHSLLQKSHLHTRALVELQNHAANSAIAAKKGFASTAPVMESLKEYPSSGEVDLTKVVEWPPRLKPVPVKPLFLDTAWNYVDYPGQAKDVILKQEAAAGVNGKKEAEKPAAKGWFGFGRR